MRGSRQLSLFDAPRRNDERIIDLMHQVNDRHGRFTVLRDEAGAVWCDLQSTLHDDA